MENVFVLNSALAVITLLFIATLISFILRNSKIPYTVALVIVGIGLGYIVENLGVLGFLGEFRLSPELVFYVFLPTLIFESAFHTNLKSFTQNMGNIISLATIGMLISTGLIATGMHYFLDFPWIPAMLFGSLISATDPISVLSLFKKIGAPKRLQSIVEGESLFNDGTALVLFGIILELANNQATHFGRAELLGSFGNFGAVVLGGVLTGLVLGFIFSKALDYVKNSKEIEISITLILAHATFIIAEYFLGVSGILATVAAGIVVGNYGAYKISPSVKEIMTHFWDYSAFIANSLLFLMVGLIIFSVNDSIIPLLVPSLMVISLVLLSRMVVVYTIIPIVNKLRPKEKIPGAWIHVIQWSGLRGALAIALMLTLPKTFPFYDEMLIFTTAVIFFTIIFNGFTIEPLLSLLGLKSFSILEKFEQQENMVLIDKRVNLKLDLMLEKKFISKDIYNEIVSTYEEHCDHCGQHIRELFEHNRQELNHDQLALVLKRHLLGVEKRSFTKLFYQGEITQELLNILLNNVNQQMDSLHSKEKVSLGRLIWPSPRGKLAHTIERIGVSNYRKRLREKEIMLRYEMFRARLIVTSDALEALEEIREGNVFLDETVISEFIKKYKTWREKAKKKLRKLEKEFPETCRDIQLYLAQQAAFHVEDKMIEKLNRTGMTSPKVYRELKKGLERRQANADL
ncbi:MAG: CPA1 family monovalent cation:H+ antiporter [Oceanicoccus sp.]|jgi:CPA1 family monovalent cation:H+ antiporter